MRRLVSRSFAALALLPLLAVGLLDASDAWTDPADPEKVFTATLRAVHGPLVVLEMPKHGTRMLAMDKLAPTDALRVEDFLLQHPDEPAQTLAESRASFTCEVRNKLARLREGKLQPVRPDELTEPRFYVLYFSAGWCGPCHRFTPILSSQYTQLKDGGSPDFEVIFVSSDEGATEMVKYMREMTMPWPAVRFAFSDDDTFRRFAGTGIPCVAVVDREGMLLFHSYVKGEYVGADEPWDRLRELLPLCRPNHPELLRQRFALHRNARLARYSANAAPPRVYAMTPIPPGPFREAGVTRFNLRIRIAADGTVIGADATENLGVGLASLIEIHARKWLFLPKVDHGRSCPSTVVLPIEFSDAPSQTAERAP